jgi:hypothetical protein
MRYAVLTLALLFGMLSCVAVAGLSWRLLGWSVAGAFQSVLHTPRDLSAHTELVIWTASSIVSIIFTAWLFRLYWHKDEAARNR